MQHLFGTADIGLDEWLRILMIGSSVLFLVELKKALIRFWMRQEQRRAQSRS